MTKMIEITKITKVTEMTEMTKMTEMMEMTEILKITLLLPDFDDVELEPHLVDDRLERLLFCCAVLFLHRLLVQRLGELGPIGFLPGLQELRVLRDPPGCSRRRLAQKVGHCEVADAHEVGPAKGERHFLKSGGRHPRVGIPASAPAPWLVPPSFHLLLGREFVGVPASILGGICPSPRFPLPGQFPGLTSSTPARQKQRLQRLVRRAGPSQLGRHAGPSDNPTPHLRTHSPARILSRLLEVPIALAGELCKFGYP